MEKTKVAIVGMGTVGTGVARLLIDHGDRTARHAGRTLWLERVVVLDLNLPGMDGMEALEHLRQRQACVLLLTAQNDVPTAVRAMQLGAENFLTKPVDMAHLAAAVARAADQVRPRPPLAADPPAAEDP